MSEHIPAQSFECRKWQYRQTKEGVVVSLLIHPNDVTPSLAMAALGTRFMVALAEINDDETAKQPSTREMPPVPPGGAREPLTVSPRAVEDSGHTKGRNPKRAWADIPLSERAGLRCNTLTFREFLCERECGGLPGVPSAREAAEIVRKICGVKSRAEIGSDASATSCWRALDAEYELFITSQMHAGSYR